MKPDLARERLQRLHQTIDAALEQLTYAQQIAISGSNPDAVPPEAATIEKLIGSCTELRNQIRQELMKELTKPSLRILR